MSNHLFFLLVPIFAFVMQPDTIHKKVNETEMVVLENRGASGLQMKYRTDKEGIVSINRLEHSKQEQVKPGDPIKVAFQIVAKQKGTVKVTFYETRPWDKNFKEIVVREMVIQVE